MLIQKENRCRQYADVIDRTHESYNHHESSQSITDRKKSHAQVMMKFIKEKGCLPNTAEFCDKSTHAKRFSEKTRMSNSIHRTNLKTMSSVRSKGQETVKKVVKEINVVGRTLEIARDRGLTTDDLLNYDIVPSPLFFDEDQMMSTCSYWTISNCS